MALLNFEPSFVLLACLHFFIALAFVSLAVPAAVRISSRRPTLPEARWAFMSVMWAAAGAWTLCSLTWTGARRGLDDVDEAAQVVGLVGFASCLIPVVLAVREGIASRPGRRTWARSHLLITMATVLPILIVIGPGELTLWFLLAPPAAFALGLWACAHEWRRHRVSVK